jgi:hypothetical protein
MVSAKLRQAVKLSDMKGYEIAWKAQMHPSTLSKILNGIERVTVGDPRIIRLAKVLKLDPNECFQTCEDRRDGSKERRN